MKPRIDLFGTAQLARPWGVLEGDPRVGQTSAPPSPSWHEPKRPAAPGRIAIRVKKRFDAASLLVFNAWLDPQIAGKWLFATASQPMTHVEIDPQVGGSFCFAERRADKTARYIGRYVEIVPVSRLAFTLSMPSCPEVVTHVGVAIALLAKGCTLKLTHANIPRAHARYVEGRWTGILYGLSVTL